MRTCDLTRLTLMSATLSTSVGRPSSSRSSAVTSSRPPCHSGAAITSWTTAQTPSSGASISALALPPRCPITILQTALQRSCADPNSSVLLPVPAALFAKRRRAVCVSCPICATRESTTTSGLCSWTVVERELRCLDAHAHLGVFVFEGVRTRRSAGMRRARTASGATKTKVLGALSLDGAMTAGDVAKATGLGHGTVSTTLSKLAKTGEVIKAERGYRLPAQSEPAVPQGGSTEA